MKKIFLILTTLLVIIVLFVKIVRNQAIETNRKLDHYLKSLHLELTGNISSIKDLGHGVYRIFLDVTSSNMDYYNPPDSLKFYLCKINKKKAELIVSSSEDFFSVGDLVVISSQKDSCYVYNNLHLLKSKWQLYIVSYHVGNSY